MQGERVEIPEYNFVTGKREWNGKKLKLGSDTGLIIEGIHALSPLLTEKLPNSLKYKIYISALTSISLDDHNWVPVRDNRLLRRIIRVEKLKDFITFYNDQLKDLKEQIFLHSLQEDFN